MGQPLVGLPESGADCPQQRRPPRPASIESLASASVAGAKTFTVRAKRDALRFEGAEHPGMSGLGDLEFDDVYELRVRDSGRHPFHLHLYHMQIASPGGCGGGHVEGEFYDTLSAPDDEDCTVRFRTADIGQKMVLHCHELEHEDDGAINFFNVVNVPEERMNRVDSPSYECPDAGGSGTEDGPAEGKDPEASADAVGDSSCNESFCTTDSDCCNGNCLHYGRCGDYDYMGSSSSSRIDGPTAPKLYLSVGFTVLGFAVWSVA